jgi:HlyD family secretion protein
MSSQPTQRSRRSIRRHVYFGLLIIMIMGGGVGGWASTVRLSGALIAPGSVVVESNVKRVQHPTGGIVGELFVREGDRVRQGDILVRLDDTITRTSLAIVTKGLDELAARRARLEAERDGGDKLVFPAPLVARSGNAEVRAILDGERKLFDLRRNARAGQTEQLRQRVDQLKDEIRGLQAQKEAKEEEIQLVNREREGVLELRTRNLVPVTKLTDLDRQAARLRGEVGQLVAQTAQVEGKISETELQILQIGRDLSSEVARETREIDGKIGEFVERKTAAEDQLKRVDIRAPQDGAVFQSTIHTVGGVINAGETVMLIVPDADALTVEAKVNPQDIDQVQVGQPALLRLSALNQRTTPEIKGYVSRISADITTDQRTGSSYFTVRIAMPSSEVTQLGDVRIVPGMPVEAFVLTGERTMMSYLVKPLSDHLMRMFREK